MTHWQLVDKGWGRAAAEFATLSEPANCREYVALHQLLAVDKGVALLDMACGAGLAVELAAARGAVTAGIDASSRLIDVARDRTPLSDLRVGDMQDLPWEHESFDVVTSFRGIWGTTPGALKEALRVLRPGGRLGITVWGHIKASPGAWALAPLSLAVPEKVANQSAMVALGRPGAGEQALASSGFVDIERVDIPFAWEFPDPDTYARALASTGPAYEAIQAVGEHAFHEYAVALATERVREGLPLRAEIAVVGYLARKPVEVTPASFIAVPDATPEVQAMYDEDLHDWGFVMNATRLWAHHPSACQDLFSLMGTAVRAGGLSFRQRGVLVTACASTLGDSYCSLAWGKKLSGEAGSAVAVSSLLGDDEELTAAERALAVWARGVVKDPNGRTRADTQPLRDAGFDDAQLVAITLFIALRLAFSTVNDALGARPDAALVASVPDQVRAAVTWGRPVET